LKPKNHKLYGARKAERRASGKGRLKNHYSKAVIKKGVCLSKPEEVAIQTGRSRLGEEMTRFLNAIGSPSLFNHRALGGHAGLV
jgi:hypothetical protein